MKSLTSLECIGLYDLFGGAVGIMLGIVGGAPLLAIVGLVSMIIGWVCFLVAADLSNK